MGDLFVVVLTQGGIQGQGMTATAVVAAARRGLPAAHVVAAGAGARGSGADAVFDVDGREGASLRAALAASDGPVVLLGGDLRTITPQAIGQLAAPVVDGHVDWSVPVYRRHRFDAPIDLGLAYPLIRALYRSAVREALAPEQALSRGLVERILDAPWSTAALGGAGLVPVGLGAARALAADVAGATVVRLGVRRGEPLPFGSGAAPEHFLTLAEALLDGILADAPLWLDLGYRYPNAVPAQGFARPAEPDPIPSEIGVINGSAQAAALPQLERFDEIFGPDLSHRIARACGYGGLPDAAFADALALTVRSVCVGALRPHDAAALLLPVWLARTASARRRLDDAPASAVDAEHERLQALLEERREGLVTAVRGHARTSLAVRAS